MTSVGREDISHSLSFGGGSGTSAGSRGAMQYVDRSLVRPEWVTGLPRGEAFVRTRGENWKVRVPLLRPVGKKEVQDVAKKYGLEGVFADLKERRERQQVAPVTAGQPDSRDERAEQTGTFSEDALGDAAGAGGVEEEKASGGAGTEGAEEENASAGAGADSDPSADGGDKSSDSDSSSEDDMAPAMEMGDGLRQ